MSRRSKKKQSAATAVPSEVALAIDAPADRLYDIVTDIARMGRLSPECTGGKWLGKATGPAVGAKFKGRNRRGPVRWSTTNEVVAANRGREFAFETKQSGARWRYRFEPDGEGTVVVESHDMFRRRPFVAWAFTKLLLGGPQSHDDEVKAGMRTTLERLKAVAEEPEMSKRRRRRARRAERKAAKAA